MRFTNLKCLNNNVFYDLFVDSLEMIVLGKSAISPIIMSLSISLSGSLWVTFPRIDRILVKIKNINTNFYDYDIFRL